MFRENAQAVAPNRLAGSSGMARYCFGIPAPARDPRPAATIMAAVLAFLMARNLALMHGFWR